MKHGFDGTEYFDGEVRGRIFVGGQSGFGKTFECIRLLEQCSGGALLFDTTGRNRLKGGTFIHTLESLDKFLRRNLNTRFRIVYQPTSGDQMDHFRGVCALVCIYAGMTFFVDEVDDFCSAKFGQSRMPQELYDIVHYGRHQGKIGTRRGVAFIATARVPTSVARGITSQASQFRLFHEDDPEYTGFYRKVTRRPEVEELLASLPLYRFILFNKESRELTLAGGKRKI